MEPAIVTVAPEQLDNITLTFFLLAVQFAGDLGLQGVDYICGFGESHALSE